MSRFYSYLNTSKKIIEQYQGSVPLAAWLKDFFAQHKQMGSKDRKQVAEIVYNYYRLGKAQLHLPIEERIALALFVCQHKPHALLQLLQPPWNGAITATTAEKLALLSSFDVREIFPLTQHISATIDASAFVLSHWQQPDVFIRIRPHQETKVLNALQQQQIPYEAVTSHCIRLNSSVKIDSLLTLNEQVVVQDYASQQVSDFLSLISLPNNAAVWDCCAASGGKSILAKDVLENIQLTVSDIRPSIIHNLKQRFLQASIKTKHIFVADLTKPLAAHVKNAFQLVICDAPCSGSGTWGRTPEQLYFFTEEKLQHYNQLQQQIIVNAATAVAPSGYFLYITCSVYQQENENAVAFIQLQFPAFQLIQQAPIIGYPLKADTMFAALFKRSD